MNGKADRNFEAKYQELNRTIDLKFRAAMDGSRDAGKAGGFSAAEICTAIAARAIRCAALAIVSGGLPETEFDGLLSRDVTEMRMRQLDALQNKIVRQ
jgi:hypothetical protein